VKCSLRGTDESKRNSGYFFSFTTSTIATLLYIMSSDNFQMLSYNMSADPKADHVGSVTQSVALGNTAQHW